jgi:hypothetical protein
VEGGKTASIEARVIEVAVRVARVVEVIAESAGAGEVREAVVRAMRTAGIIKVVRVGEAVKSRICSK